VAHAGDGNVHPVIVYEEGDQDSMLAGADALVDVALELGGTITGEHGVGSDRVHQMRRRFGATEIAAFRAIKRAFDPAGILNPGVLLPAEEDDEPPLPAYSAALAAMRRGEATSMVVPDGIHVPTTDPTPVPEIAFDEENLTVDVAGSVTCRDLASALSARRFASDWLDVEGSVRQAVEDGDQMELRAALLGVTVTLLDGPIARFGSAAIKDVAGLDAKRLVAGGGGAFGTVSRAILRVRPDAEAGS
jgi:glycolate oxidase